MKAQVISVDDKKGFIKSADSTFYFNKKSFKHYYDFHQVNIGDFVEFEPTASPKGMIANNISIIKTYTGLEINKEFIICSSEKKSTKIDIVNGFMINSTWKKSPQDCKDELISIAKKHKLNYIEFEPIQKDVFNHYNYQYTMHSYSAFIGLSAKKIQFIEEKKAIDSTTNYYNKFNEISESIKLSIKINEEERSCQNSLIYSIYIGFKKLFKFVFRLK